MSAGTQEKTEQPTGKQLDKARERGQVPKSRDLTAVAVLLTGSLAVYFSGGFIMERFRVLVGLTWSKEAFSTPGHFAASGLFTQLVLSMCYMMAPAVLVMLLTSILLNVIQMKGMIFSFQALKVSLSNLDPIQGFRRFVSLRSFTELIKSTLKLIIISYAAYSVLWPEQVLLAELARREVSEILEVTSVLGLRIIFRVCAIMFGLSMLDFLYQKWQTNKDLMMTRQQVKEEMIQAEGNPQIKSKIRSIQRALARQRMLSKVPKASVILTNPTHYAVALLYKPGMEAPVLVAKGANFLAKRIIGIGRKHGVPIIQNPPLARALCKQVKLDETIPVALYRAVAKILAYIYQQKQALERSRNG